jgi:peptidoglycan/LPS O-acetylase OafA/YrhL
MNIRRPSSTHLPALDGARGIAVLLVIAVHISEHLDFTSPPLRIIKSIAFAGWTGVDLFFVLSGFLITGILWDTKGERGYFRNFYARRTVRIFPLYYAALVILFILVPALFRNDSGSGGILDATINARHYWVWFATYLVDVLIAVKGFLFAGHFWTLAVEEHFYLLWPVLVYKLERRTLISVCVVVFVAAFLLRAGMILSGASHFAVYVLTPCRMDGLALGSCLALVIRGPDGLEALVRRARIVLPISAILWIGIMWAKGGWSQYGLIAQTVGYSVTESFYASVLIFALASRGLATALSAGVLRFFGRISYALYVFHVPIIFFLGTRYLPGDPDRSMILPLTRALPDRPFARHILAPGLDALVFTILAVGLSVGAALISWYLLERPCLRLKRLFPYHGANARAEEMPSPENTAQAGLQ